MKGHSVFANEYFRKVQEGNVFTFPKDWLRPRPLSLIPYKVSCLSFDFFEKAKDFEAEGLSLRESFHRSIVDSNCVLGVYGVRTPNIRMGWYVGEIVPIRGGKQVVKMNERRQVKLSDKLMDHLSSNTGRKAETLYFNPMGGHFILWDSDYYMDDSRLNNTLSINQAIKTIKSNAERGLPLTHYRRFG